MNFKFGCQFPSINRLFKLFNRGISKSIALGLALILGLTASLALFTQPAPAVDEFQLRYGAANIPVSFEELQTFAETGEQSNQLRSLFTLAELTPEQVANFRTALNYGVNVPPDLVDTLLSSSYGRLAVGALNLFIAPDSEIGNIVDNLINGLQSAARDGNITLVEAIVSYEGLEVITVDIEDLIALYNDVAALGEQAIAFLKAQPEVQELICN
ncbi:MAG: alpha/beta hydrolase [Lyngbya sp.]|nr:alpha/beta hydrolase [Lyngbya sp.]